MATPVRRYLQWGLLPARFVPGLADWYLHRRTRIERTSGTQESLIHLAMMVEVGVPITAALLLRVNRAVLALMGAAAVIHEATAIWDVRVAYRSPREVAPVEQHVHSFLESLPITALSTIALLHWDEVARGHADGWRLRRKDPPLPTGYIGGIAASIAALVALPYGEELVRCLREPGH